MSSLLTLESFASELRKAGCMPKHLQLARVGPYFLASAFNDKTDEVVTETATCDFSEDKNVAVTKALVEWIERRISRDGNRLGLSVCQTKRSDGIAAFPTFLPEHKLKARKNSLDEAIERFVWATWWDDTEISFDTLTFDHLTSLFPKERIEFFQESALNLGFAELKLVRPSHTFPGKTVIILLGFNEQGAVVSGGACGDSNDFLEIVERGFSEFYRHALAIKKTSVKTYLPESFYEQRLFYFGSGRGLQAVRKRLEINGQKPVILPDLIFDQEIPSSFSEFVYVHRCLFENQPPFVDGAVERLCL